MSVASMSGYLSQNPAVNPAFSIPTINIPTDVPPAPADSEVNLTVLTSFTVPAGKWLIFGVLGFVVVQGDTYFNVIDLFIKKNGDDIVVSQTAGNVSFDISIPVPPFIFESDGTDTLGIVANSQIDTPAGKTYNKDADGIQNYLSALKIG